MAFVYIVVSVMVNFSGHLKSEVVGLCAARMTNVFENVQIKTEVPSGVKE